MWTDAAIETLDSWSVDKRALRRLQNGMQGCWEVTVRKGWACRWGRPRVVAQCLSPSNGGPTLRILNFFEMAAKSMLPPLAMIRNASSQPPGEAITTMRSGEAEALPQA